MKALITGCTGFVGTYLTELLRSRGVEVIGTTSQPSMISASIIENDLTNEQAIIRLLNETKPDHIYHLAGLSNVKRSWESKSETIFTNVNLTIHLLEAARKSIIHDQVKILTIGSSEEYGLVGDEHMPIREHSTLRPMNPYGISKATVSYMAKMYYQAYGLNVVHVRAFNHIGPRQSLGFVVPDFASQIIKIERQEQDNVIYVGNLDAQRDFTDVRDIVRGYHDLMSHAHGGEIYNICSSKATAIQTILNILLSLSKSSIRVEEDEDRMRPSDIPLYIGANTKTTEITGWKPRITLEQSLEDYMIYARKVYNN